MKNLTLGGALLSAALAVSGTAWAQSATQEAFRGNLPDGEVSRGVEPPTAFPGEARAIPLPKLEEGEMRALPFADPATLEKGFGTVTRRADGEVMREGPSPEVLDALRHKNNEVSPNSAPNASEDPLFSNDESERAIVGADNRIRVQQSSSYPYRTIGLLWTERGTCSATLIGPYTVVTAAHCVYSHDAGGWAEKTVFYPGANGEGNFPYRGYPYYQTTILPGFIDYYQGYYGSVVPWDLAVVILQQDAGNDVGWLGYSPNNGYDFLAYNFGYPADKPFATMWRDKCDVSALDMAGTQYVHRCDTKPGSSGSSMYRYISRGNDGDRYVEGINVAEVDTGNRSTSYNIGVLFTGPYVEWVSSLRR